MAIYHFSVKNISRATGRSAVACAAYRSAENLKDERYGKEQDYTKKTGVEHTQIYAPDNTNPDLLDRQKLWNSVEKVERRKDATLAREFEIAFPSELNAAQRQSLLDDLCKELVKKHGVVVDACIHAPHTTGGSDERNYHAHIMFTTRSIDLATGELSAKKYRDFNKESGSETVKNWRSYFANLSNLHLEKAGFDIRVDHRSNKERGLDLEATQHEGSKVTQLRRRGIDTEISLKNDAISSRNNELKNIKQQLKQLDSEISAFELETLKLGKQKIEAVQSEQLSNDISRFYELQRNYIDFANAALKLITAQNKEIQQIAKRREKVEKTLSKHIDGSEFVAEYTILTDKNGNMPNYWISKSSTEAKIKQIRSEYSSTITELSSDFNLLSTASELTVLHRKLTENCIELEIPRERKIFGITLTSTPPSAETVAGDMEAYFFDVLDYNFKYNFNKLIRTEEQKADDAKKDLEVKKAQADYYLKQKTEAHERQKLLDIHLAKIEKVRNEYAYAPGFKYNNVSQYINLLTSLIVSDALDKKDYSIDFQKRIELIEESINLRQMTLEKAKRTYQDYSKMLESDEKFFKENGKSAEYEKITALHQKLNFEYTNKCESVLVEKYKLEIEQAKTKTNDLKRSSNNDLSI